MKPSRIAVIKKSNRLFSAGEEIKISGKVWLTDLGNLSTPQGIVERDNFYIVDEKRDETGSSKDVDPFEMF